MRIIQRHILEEAVRWSSNMLVEAFSNAQLPPGDARDHLRAALEQLALAQLKLRTDK